MAYRRNGYWYRSVRDGDQVRTEYLGSGPLAELSAELDALKREERELEWAAMRDEREAQREIDRAIGESERLVRVAVAAVLLASAYHAHMFGDGCPDIMAAYGGRSYRLEIKVEETAS